jgi:tetratricopeptide (TPR) repeat protein
LTLPGQRSKFSALAVALMGATGLAAIAVTAWYSYHRRGAELSPPNRVVAIIELNDRTQNADNAWLAPALTEMLGAQLGAADEIRVIPDTFVREASKDLAVPNIGGYGGDALAKLRKRLNADYVISGHFRVGESDGDRPLFVDVELQDARNGVLVASLSKQSGLSALNPLVDDAGMILRDKLQVSRASAGLLNQIASTQPPSTAVAQRIGFALDAMQRYDSARARDELLEAVAEAPNYAPAYLYLARAWSALGYRQKALAAAEQAANLSSTVPPELSLQIDAVVQMESYETKKAAETWRKLVAYKPLTVEYRLEAIGAEMAAGEMAAAQASLADLRRLRQAYRDPRVELVAARLAGARNDAKSEVEHGEEALRQAQAREAPGLITEAQVELATARLHLGDFEQSKIELDAAIAGYRAMGNPRGEVEARLARAATLDSLVQHQAALEEYQRAIALAQSIGDMGDVAAIYRDICAMLWVQGDRDGAQASARRALQISRSTGDLRLQSWTLRALATIASDAAATDEVLSEYREVTALAEQGSDPGGHIWSLATYADILRIRGELDEAQKSCAQAQNEAAAVSDPQFAIVSMFTCALVAVDRGETDVARLLLEKVGQLSQTSGNAIYGANVQLVLGQMNFDAAQWAVAQEPLRRAAKAFAVAEARTGEADAEALLALCAQGLKDPAERDRAAAKARDLRTAITSKQEVYLVDIALARLASGGQQRGEAVARLRELASDAQRRHWIGWSLEAKLAEWQILKSEGNEAAASLARADLEAAARTRGFNRIIALLNNAQQAAL